MKNRQEVEIVDRLSRTPKAFRDLLFLHLGRRKLIPARTLRVWQAGVRIRMNNVPVADVTLDFVSVIKNGAMFQRFRELEIEQVNGSDHTLQDLDKHLRQAGAEDHDGRPKLFHALSLPAPCLESSPSPDAPGVDHVKLAPGRHVR